VAGRPLVYRPRPGASDEVNRLRQALIDLINQTGTSLSEVARTQRISGGLRYLSKQLTDDRGPDEHIVRAIVRHCATLADGHADELTSRFTDLWLATRGDRAGAARPAHEPPAAPPAEPLDPELIAPVLELVADGNDEIAAAMLAGQYPEAGSTAGGIIAEIGRRIPDGAAGLLSAIVERGGFDFAKPYLESLAQADKEVAARVLADPRLMPPPEQTPEETAPRASILDEDPADLLGRRRAAMLRQGGAAQVVAAIIQDAQFAPIRADEEHHWILRAAQLGRADADGDYDIYQATDLVVTVARNAREDAAHILGQLLNALVADGHVELAARVLAELAEHAGDGIGAALDAMTPYTLLEALRLLLWGDRLAELRLPGSFLLARARPLVAAQLLIEREQRNPQTPEVEFWQLRNAQQILAEMISRNALLTASFIAKIISTPGLPNPSAEELRLTAAVRDLAPASLIATGQLLGRMIQLNMWDGTRFTVYMVAGTDHDETMWMVAEILWAAIRLNPNVSDHIISLRQKQVNRASIDRVLDHLMDKHPDQGREVVEAMRARTDLASATRLGELLRNGALELATELLRQLAAADPGESWDLVALAVQGGNLEAALDILAHTA
jgi:hypothetical protein